MKEFINKILDVPKLIRAIWVILWLILGILLVLKFCFGQWYPLICDNQTFVAWCSFVDNNAWLNRTILLILYTFSGNIIILSCLGKMKYSKWYWLVLGIAVNVAMYFCKEFNSRLGILAEFSMIVILIIINIKQDTFKNIIINILLPILFYVIINLWQLTLLLIRVDGEFVLTNLPALMVILAQIDYYIFLVITWIGVNIMGLSSWGWFFGKSVTELKALREMELGKENPDKKLIAKIDEAIAKKENESK